MTSNPGDICYITLAQLSHNTSSSELTLLRFCQKVGCNSFLELKDEFRNYTQHMIQKFQHLTIIYRQTHVRMNQKKRHFFLNICNTEIKAASDFFSTLNPNDIANICKTIKEKKRIFIFAHDISKIPGEFLAFRMRLLFLNVSLVDLEDIADTQKQLESLNEDDMVIFFSFQNIIFLWKVLQKKQKKVVLLYSLSQMTILLQLYLLVNIY